MHTTGNRFCFGRGSAEFARVAPARSPLNQTFSAGRRLPLRPSHLRAIGDLQAHGRAAGRGPALGAPAPGGAAPRKIGQSGPAAS